MIWFIIHFSGSMTEKSNKTASCLCKVKISQRYICSRPAKSYLFEEPVLYRNIFVTAWIVRCWSKKASGQAYSEKPPTSQRKHIFSILLYWKKRCRQKFQYLATDCVDAVVVGPFIEGIIFRTLKSSHSALAIPVRRSQRELHWASGKNSTHVLESELIFTHCCCRGHTLALHLTHMYKETHAACFLFARSLRFFHPNSPKNQIRTRSPLILGESKSDYCFVCAKTLSAARAFSPSAMVLHPIILVGLQLSFVRRFIFYPSNLVCRGNYFHGDKHLPTFRIAYH